MTTTAVSLDQALQIHAATERLAKRREVIKNIVGLAMRALRKEIGRPNRTPPFLCYSIELRVRLESVPSGVIEVKVESRGMGLIIKNLAGAHDHVLLSYMQGLGEQYFPPPRELVDPIYATLPRLLSELCDYSPIVREEIDFWLNLP